MSTQIGRGRMLLYQRGFRSVWLCVCVKQGVRGCGWRMVCVHVVVLYAHVVVLYAHVVVYIMHFQIITQHTPHTQTLTKHMAESVPIQYNKRVVQIKYNTQGGSGAVVVCEDGSVYDADVVVCTMSLGVLKVGVG